MFRFFCLPLECEDSSDRASPLLGGRRLQPPEACFQVCQGRSGTALTRGLVRAHRDSTVLWVWLQERKGPGPAWALQVTVPRELFSALLELHSARADQRSAKTPGKPGQICGALYLHSSLLFLGFPALQIPAT